MRRLVCGWMAVCLPIAAADMPPVPLTTGAVGPLIGEEIPSPPATPEALLRNGGFSPIPLTYVPPEVTLTENIPYASYETGELRLDLFEPPAGSKGLRPALIMIHGGAWRLGTKLDYRYHAGQFARRGFVTVSIDYRLAPRHKFPACLEDCRAAVNWVRSRAAELRVDPARIALFGGSAGGHLSLLTGYCASSPVGEAGSAAESGSGVAAVVCVYGVTDLTDAAAHRVPIVKGMFADFLGGSVDEIPEVYRAASPITHVRSGCPPTLVIHGTADSMVPIAQSEALVEKLREAQVPFVFDRIPGWPHAMDYSRPVNDRVVWLTERFLVRSMPPGSGEAP